MNTRHWRLAAATALLALCTGVALAQAPDSPPPGPPPDGQSAPPPGEMGRGRGPEQQLRNLTRLLTLTEDQQKGVRAVLEQQATQMRALRGKTQAEGAANDTPEARQARMTQMDQIRDESNTKIAALLDENQKKIFASWIEKRKAAMERRQSREGQPPPPDGGGPPPAPPQ